MGLGFVLIAWVILLSILLLVVSLFITVIYTVRKKKIPILKFLKFYLFIPITAIYFFPGMISVAIINEYVRGVDAGFGDSWQLPLGNDYNLCMIDTAEQGYIKRNNCSGVPLVNHIVSMSRKESIVVVQHMDKSLFELNTSTGKINPIASLPPHHPELTTVRQFYSSNRSTLADILILLFCIVIPILWFVRYWYKKSFKV